MVENQCLRFKGLSRDSDSLFYFVHKTQSTPKYFMIPL